MIGISAVTLLNYSYKAAAAPSPDKGDASQKGETIDRQIAFMESKFNDTGLEMSKRFFKAYNGVKILLDEPGFIPDIFDAQDFEKAYKAIKSIYSLKFAGIVPIADLANETLPAPVTTIEGKEIDSFSKDPWFRLNLAANFSRACVGYSRILQKENKTKEALAVLEEARIKLLETESNITRYSDIRPEGTEALKTEDLIKLDTTERLKIIEKYMSGDFGDKRQEVADLFLLSESKLADIETVSMEIRLLNKANASAEDAAAAEKYFSSIIAAEIGGNKIVDYFDNPSVSRRSNPWLKSNIMIGLSRARLNMARIKSTPEEIAKIFDGLNECMAYVLSYYAQGTDGKPVALSAEAVNTPEKAAAAFESAVKDLKDQRLADISSLYIFLNAQIAETIKLQYANASGRKDKAEADRLIKSFNIVRSCAETAAKRSQQAAAAFDTTKKAFEANNSNTSDNINKTRIKSFEELMNE